MPLFEYTCEKCGPFELLVMKDIEDHIKMADCPTCGERCVRKYSMYKWFNTTVYGRKKYSNPSNPEKV